MKPKTKTTMASLAVVGIDIGKEVFHLVGLGTDGTIAFRRKIRRLSLKDVFEQLPPCIVGMEACLSAHFVSRTLRALGHEPRIIPAIYTKPFVKGQKNDYNDAEAVAEAALRPNLRMVQEKSQDQLDLQACHRVRSRLVSRRTSRRPHAFTRTSPRRMPRGRLQGNCRRLRQTAPRSSLVCSCKLPNSPVPARS
jgi:transposase